MNDSRIKTRKARVREPESALAIIDGALKTPVKLVENGVARKVTIIEAIVFQLLRAEAEGNKRATTVRLKYQRLARNKKKQKIIVTSGPGKPAPIPQHNTYKK